MILLIASLLIGFVLGWLTDFQIPAAYESYLFITVLAALDTLFGGIRSYLQRAYDDKMFLSGFLFNLLLAYLLTFLGIHLGIDLYLAAAFAFGVRLFQNVAAIRRLLLTKWTQSKNEFERENE